MLASLAAEDFQKTCTTKAKNSAQTFLEITRKYQNLFVVPGNLASKVKAYLIEIDFLNCFQKLYKDEKEAIKRRELVDEFINSIAQFESKQQEPSTLQDFLEKISLLEENDRTDDKSDDGDGVVLSTIHASKGLEFPLVFLVAMERNIFPNERALKEDSLDEELRLFYVALTRAKRHLVITHAQERFRYGRIEHQNPSIFLRKIPLELIDSGKDKDFIQQLSADSINEGFAKIFEMLK